MTQSGLEAHRLAEQESTLIASAMWGLVEIIGYVIIAILIYRVVRARSMRLGSSGRRAIASFTLAVLMAPSLIVGEGGGGIGPAIVSIYQALTMPRIPWLDLFALGIAPILISFIVIFALRVILGLDDDSIPPNSSEPPSDNNRRE